MTGMRDWAKNIKGAKKPKEIVDWKVPNSLAWNWNKGDPSNLKLPAWQFLPEPYWVDKSMLQSRQLKAIVLNINPSKGTLG